MTNRLRIIIGYILIIIEIFAISLSSIGLYIRLIADNSIGSTYIFIGIFLALVDGIIIWLFYRKSISRNDRR
jgi:hypothetical protein